ncbi:MAG: Crp/Fnr family transcriptional regulator [Myxococcales bacterium]|nr:Crp/Fnr family transcriptional regulator [Myxococcales bacterium]MBL0194936.1 Crp/Fnr family transcriptional regulator [Myxococcales bacterium]HQY60513.1 cyclic nucleotide-binding domain-containing protein [Polyangiaceae bacterium]
MRREQVWKLVAESLRAEFGRLLDVRDVRRVRRVAGDAWTVSVVLAAPSGDLHVADLTVDDAGGMSPALDGDDVIGAVRRSDAAAEGAGEPDAMAGFGAELGAEEDVGLDLLEDLEQPVEVRVAAALGRGDAASLQEARELLPRMLADHDQRGGTLLTMAELEVKLGELGLARGYLEAAAREFADRFDLNALEKAAALALALDGPDAFTGSAVHTLLEQSRARLTPIAAIFDTRSFRELGATLRDRLAQAVTSRTLAPGESLVVEGDPSESVFVVKSGLVGVWLEKPSGGSWLVRCCFPGWLLGESSVLAAVDPRCTATLRAERVSEVWVCPAPVMRELMAADPGFAQRIAETKQLHRIDSFFSMHETMGQLDVLVRDDILSCLQRIESFEGEVTLSAAGEVPKVACLVARGGIALFEEGKTAPLAVVEADSFYGVRDAIHQMAPAVTAIALPGSTIAFFEGARLQRLCERSAENVIAVLERLG